MSAIVLKTDMNQYNVFLFHVIHEQKVVKFLLDYSLYAVSPNHASFIQKMELFY